MPSILFLFLDFLSRHILYGVENNQPAAVILSPEEYDRLNEIEEDFALLLEAEGRLAENTVPTVSMEDVMKESGITQEEADAIGDVEIE